MRLHYSIFVICLFLITVTGFSQNRVKLIQLKKDLTQSESDTSSIKILFQLSEEYSTINAENALDYAAKALIIAKQINSKKFEGQAFNLLGGIELYNGNTSSARDYFVKMLEAYKEIAYPKGTIEAINNLGDAYYLEKRLDKALEFYMKSLNIATEKEIYDHISKTYNCLGNIYSDLQDYSKAIDYYNKSVQILEVSNNQKELAAAFDNLGQVYFMLKKYPKSIGYFEKSLIIGKNIGNKLIIAQSLNKLGKIYEELGRYGEALVKYQAAEKLVNKLGNSQIILNNKINIGSIQFKLGLYDRAIGNIEKSIWLAKEIADEQALHDAYLILYQIYEEQGEFQKALESHKLYASYQDSVLHFESVKHAKELEAKFGSSKKDKEIAQLTQRIEESIPFWKTNWFYLAIFFVSLFAIGILFFKVVGVSSIISPIGTKIYLGTLRILLLTGMIAYPLVGVFYTTILVNIYDPIVQRILISAFVFAIYLGSYFIDWIKRNLDAATIVVAYLITAHICFLCYMNDIRPEYLFGTLIILSTISAIFTSIKSVSFYSGFVVLLTILTGAFVEEPKMNTVIFFVISVTGVIISFVVSISKYNVNNQLSFSHNIISQVEALIFVTDSTGKLIFVGDSVKKILGFTPYKILSEGWAKVLGIEQKKALEIEKAMALIAQGKKEPRPFTDAKLLNSEGEERWIQWRDRKIKGNMVLGMGHDITEKKKNEDEIKRLSLVASKTDNYVIISDKNDLINWTNKGFEQILGFSKDEMMGKKALELFEEDNAPEIIEGINRTLFEHKRPHVGELSVRTKAGRKKWLGVNITPVLDKQGELEQIICIGNDITAKKTYEMFLHRLTDKLQLIHTIERSILNAESTDDIIIKTLDQLFEKLPIKRASLVLFDYNQDIFFTYSNSSEQSELQNGKKIPLSSFGALDYLKKKKSKIVSNISKLEAPSETDKILLKEGINSYILCPLIKEDELIGSLNISFETTNNIGKHIIQLTEEVAQGLGVAIAQSRLKEEIAISHKELTEKNKDITASINYAKMIQQAYLPDRSLLDHYFNGNFILYRPRDIVSGDFYWIDKYNDWVMVAAADCTGHGVPGAFMTMIGMNQLKNIIHEKGVTRPGEILKSLHLWTMESLSTDDSKQVRDGMDVALCSYNVKTKEFLYAGAWRPLIHIHKGKLNIIDPEKLSIGEKTEDIKIDFETIRVDYEPGDSFYIFSDGFQDQFGGELGRKFSKKSLRQLIQDHQHLPMKIQEEIYNKTLTDWQGDHFQMDDILMIGFKI